MLMVVADGTADHRIRFPTLHAMIAPMAVWLPISSHAAPVPELPATLRDLKYTRSGTL